MKLSVQTFQFSSGPETRKFYACPRHKERLKDVHNHLFWPIDERIDDACDCSCDPAEDFSTLTNYENHSHCYDCDVCKGENGP